MTPTTAAVIADKAVASARLPRSRSTNGAQRKIQKKHGAKVTQVARRPPSVAATIGDDWPEPQRQPDRRNPERVWQIAARMVERRIAQEVAVVAARLRRRREPGHAGAAGDEAGGGGKHDDQWEGNGEEENRDKGRGG